MNGCRVSGNCDDDVRVVDDLKIIGFSDKLTSGVRGLDYDLRVVDDRKIIAKSDGWTSGVWGLR